MISLLFQTALQIIIIILFFFNDTATTEIYTLSLHDALPIFFASTNVRKWNHNAAIEASRTQKSGIKNVWPVGGGDQDHTFIRFKPIHFDEQLVERLLALIMSAAQTCAAMASNRVNFVDEDDAGSVFLSLLKQIAHAACAHAHKHLNKV